MRHGVSPYESASIAVSTKSSNAEEKASGASCIGKCPQAGMIVLTQFGMRSSNISPKAIGPASFSPIQTQVGAWISPRHPVMSGVWRMASAAATKSVGVFLRNSLLNLSALGPSM